MTARSLQLRQVSILRAGGRLHHSPRAWSGEGAAQRGAELGSRKGQSAAGARAGQHDLPRPRAVTPSQQGGAGTNVSQVLTVTLVIPIFLWEAERTAPEEHFFINFSDQKRIHIHIENLGKQKKKHKQRSKQTSPTAVPSRTIAADILMRC